VGALKIFSFSLIYIAPINISLTDEENINIIEDVMYCSLSFLNECLIQKILIVNSLTIVNLWSKIKL